MALSGKRIEKERENGNIIIEPFNPKQLCNSSYDVTLGEYFYRPKEDDYSIYNMNSEECVKNTWELERAILASELKQQYSADFTGIKDTDRVILIGPGETLLCHTNEFIGGKVGFTTMMKSRSSFGRNFMESCSCAGWGDVGYVNRWTMEIHNRSHKRSVFLVVGRRVAQIVFLEVDKLDETNSMSYAGKYQSNKNIDELMTSWKPEMMLPKMYLDPENY
jgi:dCTP deaminase